MRMIFKAHMDTEIFNAAAKAGTAGATLQAIIEDLKPEAAYFIAENGKRTALLIVDIPDSTHLPRIAEPWFLAFNAEVEATPAFTPADMEKIMPTIEAAVKKYA